MRHVLCLTGVALLLPPAPANADPHSASDALINKVGKSFSALSFGNVNPSFKHKLHGCKSGDMGEVCKDYAGVELTLYGEGGKGTDHVGELTISVAEYKGKFIPALGIGTARSRSLVVTNVERFIGGHKLTCESDSNGDYPKPDFAKTMCNANLNNSYARVTVEFNQKDELVRMSATDGDYS